MRKIKILFYSHTIDFAGTWRSHERVLLMLNKEIFDVYVFYNPNQNNNRLEYLKTKLNCNNIIPFTASKEKSGPDQGYRYLYTDFIQICKTFDFDIIHFARGGWYEWPFIERIAPIQIETNIFGGRDTSPFLDYSITICNTINSIRGGSDQIIYNPIPDPIKNNENILTEFNIPETYLVFGRIGRPSNFDPIALNALYELKKQRNDFVYIIIGACQETKDKIKQLNLSDVCLLLEPTNDDNFIHRFYNSLDLFLHYRSDGECHSCAISEAMIYGVPVISHYAGYNGQSETIKNGGYVAKNSQDYYKYLSLLINDIDHYTQVSNNAKNISENYKQNKIVKEWETLYTKLFNQKEAINYVTI